MYLCMCGVYVCVYMCVCVCVLHNISKRNLSRNTKLEYLVAYVCVLQWMKSKALEASKLLLLLRKRNLMSVNIIVCITHYRYRAFGSRLGGTWP